MTNQINDQRTGAQPEFGNIRTVMAMFGLSRTEVYQLIKDRKIRAAHDKKIPGSKHGVYRIYIDSVRQYMHQLLEQVK